MDFICTRTSGFEVQPHINATTKKFPRYEIRTCKSFQEFDNKFGGREGTWLSKGTNHALCKDGIIRETGTAELFILTINTVEELLEYVKDELLILKFTPQGYAIEIYDDYRE